MNEKRMKDTAKLHAPKQTKGKNALTAFVCGGTMGLIGQILLELYINTLGFEKDSALSLMIVTFIFVTALLTGLGVYDKIAQKCGAGLFIPISGFANSLTSAAMEGRSEGPVYGIGSNMFKLAGSVLTYGVVSACIFGSIRFLLFGG